MPKGRTSPVDKAHPDNPTVAHLIISLPRVDFFPFFGD